MRMLYKGPLMTIFCPNERSRPAAEEVLKDPYLCRNQRDDM